MTSPRGESTYTANIAQVCLETGCCGETSGDLIDTAGHFEALGSQGITDCL